MNSLEFKKILGNSNPGTKIVYFTGLLMFARKLDKELDRLADTVWHAAGMRFNPNARPTARNENTGQWQATGERRIVLTQRRLSDTVWRGVHSGEALMKHGLFVGANRHAKWSRLYTVWTGMLARCRGGPHHPDYKKYGARGIKVCQRWQQYKNFAKDVGPHPGKEWSLDRWPNNDGNYEPGNWRWATRTMQIRNSRAVKLDIVRADDVRRRLSMGVPQRTIAKAFGVSQSTIQHINAGKIWRHEQQP